MAEDTIRIVLENVDFRLPTQVTDDNSVLALKSLVFEPLVRWSQNGVVSPGLFNKWEASEDARTWQFHIRKQTTFHDGLPCTADAIVVYIKGFLTSHDYFGMPWSYNRYFAKTRIESDGDDIVRFTDEEPFPDLPNILCDFWPSRIDGNNKPILGTGPYRVVDFERPTELTGHATLELVEPSSSTILPRRVIATTARDGEDRLELLRAGEVDVALNLERADDLKLINFDNSLQWGKVPSTLSVIYYLNCPSGIFSDPKVRRAANLAVDHEALVKEIYLGLATPAATVVSPNHLGFADSGLKPIPYDPEQARKLVGHLNLDEPILLRTPVYMPEHAEKITSFVKRSLESIGFHVKVELETNRPEYARSIGLRKNIGDLALFDSTPNTTFRVLDDKLSSASHGTWWLGYHDDAFQKLFHKARTTVQQQERGKAYAACLAKLQENPPWLFIAHPDVIWASKPGVSVHIDPSGVLRFESHTS
jgi:peptide/nickel transport system substrate-binding protein